MNNSTLYNNTCKLERDFNTININYRNNCNSYNNNNIYFYQFTMFDYNHRESDNCRKKMQNKKHISVNAFWNQ